MMGKALDNTGLIPEGIVMGPLRGPPPRATTPLEETHALSELDNPLLLEPGVAG
jgi:hypothetical protein